MSATRDEVLRKMAEAIDPHGCNWANGLPGPLKGQALRQAERALAAAEQAGWRLVPVEADEAMWGAGRYQIVAGEGALDIWNAMCAAAPKVTP